MLKIKNIKFSYKESVVIDDISFGVPKGKLFCITGSSGSGKSTLLKIINGVVPEINGGELSGEIILDGVTLTSKDIFEKSSYISTVFQNPKTQFYCVDSTDEFAFPLENRNIPKDEIIKTITKYTQLLNTEKLLNQNIFTLSGGEKQLMAITSVLTMNNQVYLFDEPSASLDHNSIELFKNILINLKKEGKIIIIAEHRLYYLMEIIDTLVVLKEGKLNFYSNEFIQHQANNKFENKHDLRKFEPINIDELKKEKHYYQISMFNRKKRYELDCKLECINFVHNFNNKKIMELNYLGFSNEIYFIIGKNGVGKSTFIKKMSGILKGEGTLYYKNVEVKKRNAYISMVMQDVNYQLFTESVWDEISMVTTNSDKKKKILMDLDLYQKRDYHPHTLSGGEKQRLMVALAIASHKPIVILDEPTSGLCKKQMISVVKYLQDMKKQNKTIIVVTHDYEFIQACEGVVYEFLNDI